MAMRTLTRTDITALATRLERHTISLNIPYGMAQDMRLAFLALRHALEDKAFDKSFEIVTDEPVLKRTKG